MAEAKNKMSVFVTGGAEDVGLATARALLKRGHKVVASACTSEGALALRQAGALPVYPDLGRASSVLSALEMAQADVVVHAIPQFCGGLPHSGEAFAARGAQLLRFTEAVAEAAARHGVGRFIALSFGYLYEAGHDAAQEGDQDIHDSEYAPMLAAEALLKDSRLNGYIVRSGYVYGGANPSTAALADAVMASRRLPAGAAPASWIHEDDLAAVFAALLEAETEPEGMTIINAAADSACSPDDCARAISAALGLDAPRFAGEGRFDFLRQKTLRDKLLDREVVISSRKLRDEFGWQPRHATIESGMEAAAMVWRMQDAVNADDFYNAYEDKAAQAIEDFAYDVALPEPVAAAETPVAAAAEAAPEPTPVPAAPPPPSDGPTPWNEDEAKREERRRRALERKAKRAARG
ncbi:MAG: NAD(P)H-binding protein [Chloroflexi bacterium]|nr:NAD(P)H-binding protein [Chloroflexota bacterium]